MSCTYEFWLIFEPQPEGGYTVTCPILPELITEGDTIADAMANVEDALVAIIEACQDLGRPLPPVLERVALGLRTPFVLHSPSSILYPPPVPS